MPKRKLAFVFLPAILFLWIIGWTLFCVGKKTMNRQTTSPDLQTIANLPETEARPLVQ